MKGTGDPSETVLVPGHKVEVSSDGRASPAGILAMNGDAQETSLAGEHWLKSPEPANQ
ncbi:MAG: hypothetical protein GX442_04100 [Candidatus Riflebacteria bacterium]|nr:hypothetical protein [Candidatus Riflebacteria bacterium]